jgi:hypothetical protein
VPVLKTDGQKLSQKSNMAEELKSSAEGEYKLQEKNAAQAAPSLDESLKTLERTGGFEFLEAIVDGIDNLNPSKKARTKIFKTDSSKKEQRKQLKQKMQMWVDVLSNTESIRNIIEKGRGCGRPANNKFEKGTRYYARPGAGLSFG